MAERGGGSTSFPRSLQWVYSNTERCRGKKGDGERNREREREKGVRRRTREGKGGREEEPVET